MLRAILKHIAYDQKTDIHSITDESGNTIILFCMNNELHWPHTTPSIPAVPTYTEVSFEDFFNANPINVNVQDLKTWIENVLYAGYPYNGFGLYQVVETARLFLKLISMHCLFRRSI